MSRTNDPARAEVLAAIRRSLGVTGAEAPRRAAVEERLANAPRGVIPARGQADGEERLAVFAREVEISLATIARVESAEAVPAAIAEFLREHNLPAAIRMGEDERLAAMPWDETALAIERGPSAGGDLVGVSHAFGGVAETGTLALVSGPQNPSTLNFLPDTHVVVVRASDVARDYESLWARLRETYGRGLMPRTVNWVTGPSRSGDIEQRLFLGAHGPRRLHVVLVEG
ncbi:lactate utilization protein C [Salinarimonas sp.]|uniref:LutC/YkgG family protein n=1 Tax=Salinarimonas sp. TaxID=2766526 RepID=UPI0039198589